MLEIKFTEFPVLETERLLLRQMTMDDAPALFELRTNAEVTRYIDHAKVKSIDESIAKLKVISDSYENNNGIAWAIVLKETGKQIGDISFWRIMKEHHRAEIGYSLLNEHWKKGIMTEAAKKVIEYGFSVLKFHSIEGNVNPNNVGSIKLLEKMGFVREAYFKEDYYFDGKFLDSAIYSLLTNS